MVNPTRQGIPVEQPTEVQPEFDGAASRERQLEEHNTVRDGKKDGYRLEPRDTTDSTLPIVPASG